MSSCPEKQEGTFAMTYRTRIAAFAAAALASYGISTHKASAQDVSTRDVSTREVYSWSNLPRIQQPVFRKDTVRISAYGAVADGHTLNTRAINQAIESCSKKGGGVVLVPAGLWITGPVVLKSNVNLHLSEGALLLFTTDKSQYAITEGFYEGKAAARNESPISGKNLENVAITGKGIVDGNGDVWRGAER
jgi:polygalacturonase